MTDRIKDMTISQAREAIAMGEQIAEEFGGVVADKVSPSPMIGKFVIVRCREAGVHAGVLMSRNGRSCVLSDARRLWKFRVPMGASDFLDGAAVSGITDDSRVGTPVTIELTENCEIIRCSEVAEKSIREAATWVRTQ